MKSTPVSAIGADRLEVRRPKPRAAPGRRPAHRLAQHRRRPYCRAAAGRRRRPAPARSGRCGRPRPAPEARCSPPWRGAPLRRRRRNGDMIVLDQHAVIEPHAVVLRPAHPRRIFLQHTQPGNGLARVEQDRAGAIDRVDVAPSQRGDAGQMLERIERRPFGGEHRPRVAVSRISVVPGSTRVAIRTSSRSRPPDRAREKTPPRSPAPRRQSAARHSITAVKRASAAMVASRSRRRPCRDPRRDVRDEVVEIESREASCRAL